jgi:hypothetical protein
MSEQLVVVNQTLDELPLELTFSMTTMMRWMLTAQMQVVRLRSVHTVACCDASAVLRLR